MPCRCEMRANVAHDLLDVHFAAGGLLLRGLLGAAALGPAPVGAASSAMEMPPSALALWIVIHRSPSRAGAVAPRPFQSVISTCGITLPIQFA